MKHLTFAILFASYALSCIRGTQTYSQGLRLNSLHLELFGSLSMAPVARLLRTVGGVACYMLAVGGVALACVSTPVWMLAASASVVIGSTLLLADC